MKIENNKDVKASDYFNKYLEKRFGKLTIKKITSIINDKGKKEHIAYCVCDCGNSKKVLLKYLQDGKVKSCGCLLPKNKAYMTSIEKTTPEILAHWDYNKNTANPENISVKAKRKVWWICNKCGNSYQQSVSSYINNPTCTYCAQLSLNNVLKIYPDLVNDEWDYEKNSVFPEHCLINSTEKIWWKSNHGESYKATIKERTTIKNGSTSFPEQTIYFYLKKIFADAVNRKKLYLNQQYIEADIYIPSIRTVIEYDGKYWHRKRIYRDELKNKLFKEYDINLIRIRETGSNDLNNNYGEVIIKKTYSTEKGFYLHEVVNKIMLSIKKIILDNEINITKEIEKAIDDFEITKEVLINDSQKIYSLYYTAYQKNNITKTCLIKYWDYDFNADLLPQNVNCNANIICRFICPEGYKIQVRPSGLNIKEKINCKQDDNNCFYCNLYLCPFYCFLYECNNCVIGSCIKLLSNLPEARKFFYKENIKKLRDNNYISNKNEEFLNYLEERVKIAPSVKHIINYTYYTIEFRKEINVLLDVINIMNLNFCLELFKRITINFTDISIITFIFALIEMIRKEKYLVSIPVIKKIIDVNTSYKDFFYGFIDNKFANDNYVQTIKNLNSSYKRKNILSIICLHQLFTYIMKNRSIDKSIILYELYNSNVKIFRYYLYFIKHVEDAYVYFYDIDIRLIKDANILLKIFISFGIDKFIYDITVFDKHKHIKKYFQFIMNLIKKDQLINLDYINEEVSSEKNKFSKRFIKKIKQIKKKLKRKNSL